ncbi:hypothetical protein SASPL_121167 [Salvia splendens]|uniref:Uncharacterized protein n=1 Tax=Salvia splendens TaxID=180675 RepID=A0A8X8XRX6_SALSN|nr:hypothetical protein SASPL_121167 [Salvia splendens]
MDRQGRGGAANVCAARGREIASPHRRCEAHGGLPERGEKPRSRTIHLQPELAGEETIFKDKGVERAANVNGDLKAKKSGKEDWTGSADRNNRKDGNRKNKRKGRRRGSDSSEFSESYYTSSESDLDDVNDVATDPDSGPTNVHFPRRSFRKRQNVSYDEGAGDDDVAVPRWNSEATMEEEASMATASSLHLTPVSSSITYPFFFQYE